MSRAEEPWYYKSQDEICGKCKCTTGRLKIAVCNSSPIEEMSCRKKRILGIRCKGV